MLNNPRNITLGILYATTLVALTAAFYLSPIRESLESRLYDARTRVAQSRQLDSRVKVVGLEPLNISESENPEQLRVAVSRKVSVAQKILALAPRAVAVLISPPYNNPELTAIAALAARDKRLFIGTFEIRRNEATLAAVPQTLKQAKSSIFTADLETYFKRRVARSLPFESFAGIPSPYLLPQLASLVSSSFTMEKLRASGISHRIGDEQSRHFLLNYLHPSDIPVLNPDDIKEADITGNVVLVGQSNYLEDASAAVRYSNYVNSPWQEDGAPIRFGVPKVKVLANGLSNLIKGSWLRPVPTVISIINIALITIASFIIWRMSVVLSVLAFLLGWVVIVWFHGFVLFSHWQLYFPLADALMFSSLATIAGGLWRLRIEGRLRAVQEAREQSEKDLSNVQNKFLDRFAGELGAINNQVLAIIDDLEVKDADLLEKAKESAHELADYLTGIQQFSSLSDLKATFRPTQVEACVKRVISRFDSLLQDKAITIQESIASVKFTTDPILFEQIFLNLLSNAIKYSPEGSEIAISLEAQDGLRLTVKDSGPGIPNEQVDKIFEKFYRIKDDMVYKVKGQGLGLYLSRYFAHLINGEISVTSSTGEGATFVLQLHG